MATTNSPLNEPQAKPSIVALLMVTVQTLIVGLLALILCPLYVLGKAIWYRPPNTPHRAQIKRYLRLARTVRPPSPGMSRQARFWLMLTIIRRWLMTPLSGLAWLLDELLYGRQLEATSVVDPLFVISAGRSGSTQMTRYLEDDPTVSAPNLLQSLFPYLWLWRLAPKTIGRFVSKEQVRERLESMMPPELLERHESDPFRADTFDAVIFSAHLNQIGLYFGPDVSWREFNFARLAAGDQERMAQDFVVLVDRLGRKQQIFTGDAQSTAPRRLFIKGHFLFAAAALAERYPDATFLTLVREPASRLRSTINYIRVNPSDPAMGPPPWPWLAASLLKSESQYCRLEQAWYSQQDSVNRCVVRFVDFVADLEGTMTMVYQRCFNIASLPAHVPRAHTPRERKHYSVNYTLAELGIDAGAVRADLADYVAWCESRKHPRTIG